VATIVVELSTPNHASAKTDNNNLIMLNIYRYRYFSLINKNTNEEVYTSPQYTLEDNETTDYSKVFEVFKFYYDRINSGIKQQLESPRTTEEQKKNLKYIGPKDFNIAFMELVNDGGYHKTTFWTKDLAVYNENYKFS
jgi:hypothetical protein